jgi:hypothetical protein
VDCGGASAQLVIYRCNAQRIERKGMTHPNNPEIRRG